MCTAVCTHYGGRTEGRNADGCWMLPSVALCLEQLWGHGFQSNVAANENVFEVPRFSWCSDLTRTLYLAPVQLSLAWVLQTPASRCPYHVE